MAKHITSRDPRKLAIATALKLKGGGTKVTNLVQDGNQFVGNVLRRENGGWKDLGRVSVPVAEVFPHDEDDARAAKALPPECRDDGILDALMELHKKAEPRDPGPEIYVWNPQRHVYLSGVPYTWTSYGERAFVFKNESQAAEFIQRFRRLAGCEVGKREGR